jgi:serine/threonine protein kinase
MSFAYRTCHACGFENAEVEKACPLCGGSSTDATAVADVTAVRASEWPTLPTSRGSASLAGKVYDGRFEVQGLVGRGGMGQVLRVVDRSNGRTMALKVIRPQDDDDPDRGRRFKREIESLAKIRHPAVLQVAQWGYEGGELFFVSELIDGEDLKLVTERRGPWPPAEAAAAVATVAEALAAAHKVGIVHRDVKPSNIMLARDGSIRLLDFGLARGFGVDVTTLTRTGMIVGTPAYMAPEQFEAASAVDERTDVYSLGIVLFELLTGRLPFSGSTPIGMALKHKTEAPPALASVNADVPAWLDRVVHQCLQKDPARRFPSASALAAVLRKTRTRTERRALPSGDVVVDDPTQVSDWALVLESPEEKTGWSAGMALCYDERYFQLVQIAPPARVDGVWTYRFALWPEGVVFRKRIDYEQDCLERDASREQREQKLSSKLGRWLRGDKPKGS